MITVNAFDAIAFLGTSKFPKSMRVRIGEDENRFFLVVHPRNKRAATLAYAMKLMPAPERFTWVGNVTCTAPGFQGRIGRIL